MDKLESLELRDNNILQLKENTFSSLSKLLSLTFVNNKTTFIHKNAFNGLKSIQYLDLSELSHLKELEAGIFDPICTSLLGLEIRYHRFRAVDPTVFRNLSRLRSLNITGLDLDTFNTFIFKDLISLLDLEAKSMSLKSIGPNTFKNLVNLRRLSLGTYKVKLDMLIESNSIDKLFSDFSDSLECFEYNGQASKKAIRSLISNFKNLKFIRIAFENIEEFKKEFPSIQFF
jgi:hypothetical protein